MYEVTRCGSSFIAVIEQADFITNAAVADVLHAYASMNPPRESERAHVVALRFHNQTDHMAVVRIE